MELRVDIELKHPVWKEISQLVSSPESKIGCFNRLVDLYIVACTIGIYYDSTIENNGELENTIGRNTYQSNYDVSEILDFLFQNAILTTSTIKYDVDTKLRIAFDPDYTLKDFSPIQFLTRFANYGATKILDLVSNTDTGTISSILNFLDDLISDDYEELLSTISLSSYEIQKSI